MWKENDIISIGDGMEESVERFQNTIVHGTCENVLPRIPSNTIHLTFTSPPYFNAREYAQYASYDIYLDFLRTIFLQIHRITQEGRFLVVNTSPVIEARESRQEQSTRYAIPFDLNYILTRMGWDFIDDIVWEKPEGSTSGRVAGFDRHRKPLGYKPNSVTEYVMVYRKHTDRLIDWNMKQYSDVIIAASLYKGQYPTTNVWNINPAKDDVHSAVFPEVLCEHIIRLYSYIGDLVLDPFAGSGTVGRVAVQHKRYFLLLEKERQYIDRFLRLEETHQNAPLFTNPLYHRKKFRVLSESEFL